MVVEERLVLPPILELLPERVEVIVTQYRRLVIQAIQSIGLSRPMLSILTLTQPLSSSFGRSFVICLVKTTLATMLLFGESPFFGIGRISWFGKTG